MPAAVDLINRSGAVVDHFGSMRAAMSYIYQHRLGPDWGSPVMRGAPDCEDEALMLGHDLRSALHPHWRDAQFKMLFSREISAIPEIDAENLADDSIFSIEAALLSSGMEWPWVAEYGSVAVRHRMTNHAWLRHDDGHILDLMGELAGGPHLRFIRSDDVEALEGFRPGRAAKIKFGQSWSLALPERLTAERSTIISRDYPEAVCEIL